MVPYTGELNLAGWFHLAYFGLLLPVAAFRQRRTLLPTDRPPPDRLGFLQKTAAVVVMLTTLSLLVAWAQGVPLFPRALPPVGAVLAGVAMYATAVACMRPRWRRAVERRARVLHLYTPGNAAETAWWVGLSLVAGVGEEITWRGVQPALIGCVGGGAWLAALLSATSFGLTHIVQGWPSVGIVVAFALGFHALTWLAGSLYVAMAVHVAYDITAGLTFKALGRQLAGKDPGPAETPP